MSTLEVKQNLSMSTEDHDQKTFFSFIVKTISYQHNRLRNLNLNQLKIFLTKIKPW